MLTARALRSLLVAMMLFWLSAIGAHGEAVGVCLERNPVTGLCTKMEVSVGTGSQSGGSAGGGSGGSSAAGERVCSYRGQELRCNTSAGVWSNSLAAWCRTAEPPPPHTDEVWAGRTDGAVYVCIGPDGSLVPDPGLSFFRWLPAPPDAVTQAEAEAAARRVLASIGLEAIDLGMQPRGDTTERMGFVGWHTWLWADSPSDKQWGPVTATASDSGIAVRLTAGATRVQWDMGDGATVSCGRGTAWSAARTQGGKNVASPDCGHVYEQDGRYTVTATSTWSVNWSAAGFTGTLPLQLSRSADVVVGEVQAVTVR